MLYYWPLAMAPGLLWLWYFRRKDDLDPEPRSRLLWSFAAGAAAAFGVLLLRPYWESLLPAEPTWSSHLWDAYGVTAGVEEAGKLLCFYFVAYRHRAFDEPLDGIIYGVAVGLGFASLENFLYLEATNRPVLVVERAFTSVLAHVAFTGGAGYFFGIARFARRPALWMIPGLLGAVFLHGTYDILLLLGGTRFYLALLMVLPLSLLLLGLKIRWHRARSPEYHSRA